ncbi:RloB family protein [Nocardia bovistercoris]|uniref:RloB domain-containing protein n=1 Tax=Nocardia bovistercoris TaxID=2785916 RepID=A0A931IGW3_9NOCA|nr:RloB family protein [Nocardia bovistercoris]MBH0776819.1 RloB domain-containing protein [Nocardia bovistercoris]MBH0781199.1 RloB domain-containing protein [Nocardia bovistercoris]
MSAKDRGKKGKPLKRRTETKPVRTTFPVYAEGKSTEPEYIDALKRLPEFTEAVSVDVSIEEAGATPMRLVESACADKRRADLDIDFYWCVFDVEFPQNHPHLDRARQMATDNGVRLAISNPCFEIWLILHHCRHAGHISTDGAIQLRRELDGSDGKHLDGPLYMKLADDAVRHAQSLREKHRRDGTEFPDDNPSSSVDLFVTHLRQEVRSAMENLRTATHP